MENLRWKINLSGASLGFDRIFRGRNPGNQKNVRLFARNRVVTAMARIGLADAGRKKNACHRRGRAVGRRSADKTQRPQNADGKAECDTIGDGSWMCVGSCFKVAPVLDVGVSAQGGGW